MSQTPTPSIPTLTPGSDTGSSDTDGITDIGTPTLSGTAAPGSLITLYDSDGVSALIPTGVANAQGFWSIAVVGVLDDGFHEITAVAALPGQTASLHSPPLAVVIDTAPPDPPTAPLLIPADDSGMSATDGITDKNVLHLTGHSEPGATVTLIFGTKQSDGSPGPARVLAAAPVAADGSYTLVTPALPDDVYTFSVVATDVAGNTTQVTPINIPATMITIDTEAPDAPATPTLSPGSDTGVLRSDGLTSTDTPTVVGAAEANATIELFDGDAMVGTATADAKGNYAVTAGKLDEGAHALTVKAVDAAGNVGAASPALNIVIDDTAPTATITPAPATLGAGSVAFMVHFSEAVADVSAGDFGLVATNTVSGSVQSVTGSAADYVVTVSGLDGQGTVGLSLVPGAITDLAGNAAVLAESDTHAVSGTTQPSTIEVSDTSSGLLVNGIDGALSASGRLVAFTSVNADELTSGPAADGTANIVARDTLLGKTVLVSLGLDGSAANGDSQGASVSADGNEIAFASDATNLVDGGTEAGVTNVYLARLTEGASGPEVTSIQLISEGNGQQGEGANPDGSGAFSKPFLSADGSTVAFNSTQALVAGAESGVENVYAANVTTGAITLVSGGTGMDEYGYAQETDPVDGETFTALVPEPDEAPGAGGDLPSDVTSISADGTLIAYESTATDLGGDPIKVTDDIVAPSRGYVYNTLTGVTTNIDGTAVLDPSADYDTSAYQTYDPVLSGDGSKVFYELHYALDASLQSQDQSLYQYNLATGVTTPVFIPDSSNGDEVYNFDTSASKGGSLVLSQDNPGLYTDQQQYQAFLFNPATGTSTALEPGYAEALSSAGNAYVVSEQPDGELPQLYETDLGVSVGIGAIGGDDTVGASMLSKAVASGGLAVTGTTNAPRGASVQVQLFGASASNHTLNSPVVLGTADGLGHWSAIVPTALLQSADGNYALAVQVGTAAGNSFFSVRDFIVDTTAPDTPDASVLDAGSDTSLAGDGSATSQDMPVLTGTAEAGAMISLFDSLSATPGTAVGTATADANGVYVISPMAALINGTHAFTVTATDAAGNVSALSAPDTVTIDTIAPDTPNAPMLQPAPASPPPFAGSSFDQPATPVGSDTGRSDTDGITMNSSPTLTGSAEPGTTVMLYDTDGISVLGTATADAKGGWTIAPGNALAEGAHTLTVTDTDAAGNVSGHSAGLNVVIDTLPPIAPAITSVAGDAVSGMMLAPIVSVTGMAEPDSLVTLSLDGAMSGIGADFGHTIADADGNFTLESNSIPAGQHKLQVTATDVAGNVSQLSLPVYETIADLAKVPPIGSNLGDFQDGPISGGTVFVDVNGNGVQDPGEASAITDAAGDFALPAGGGELVGTGGTDTTTGLSLPGALTAPAGASVIDPLTTLLDAIIARTGDSVSIANAAVAAALGLLGGGGTDLTTLDPDAAALSGSASLDPAVADGAAAVADAKLADLAVDFTAVLSTGNGNASESPQAIFATVFGVLAAQIAALPGGTTLDLDDPVTLLATLQAASEIVRGPTVSAVAQAAVEIVAAGNAQLDSDAAGATGQALLTGIAGIQSVEQGRAATALAQITTNPTLATTLVPQITGAPLVAAASLSAALITEAPRLAPGSNLGASAQDDFTDDLTPTFVGTALPGTFVTLIGLVSPGGLGTPITQGQVLGSVQADATGHYSITIATPLTATGSVQYPYSTLRFAAVGSTTDQNLAIGAIVALPQGGLPQTIVLDAAGLSDGGRIQSAISAVAPGDDAGHSALLLAIAPYTDEFLKVDVYADGGATPIATGADYGEPDIVLTTTPLSLGAHVLTLTETLQGGEIITGNAPFDVTVDAATEVDGIAWAVGPIAGATVTQENPSSTNSAGQDTVRAITGPDGAYAATVDPRTGNPLTLTGGYDTITGLPIGGPLADFQTIDGKGGATITAPDDATTISPLVSAGDGFGGGDDGEDTVTVDPLVSAGDGFGGDDGEDPGTVDPLAQAQAGDTAPLLLTIELLDTVTVLARANLIPYTFEPFAGLDDAALGNPSDIATAIQDYTDPGTLTAEQITEVLAIAAAGNAAIDAHAAGANSLADTLSYAFAAERLEQAIVAPAVDQEYEAPGDDSLPAAVGAYTGTALNQAIDAQLGQATQAISLLPQGPSSTGAPTVAFRITFSKAVSDLGSGAFRLVVGTGLEGAAITGVAAVAGSGGTAWDVSVSTGIGTGTLAVTYLGGGVASSAGEPITAGVIAPAVTAMSDDPTVYNAVVVGDFTGDGRPDAALISGGDGHLAVTPFLNTGNGAFQAEAPISNDADYDAATSPIVADVNGDGRADILLADFDGAFVEAYGGAITVLAGHGDGTFGNPVNISLGFNPTEMVAGDFDGDGRTDLALTDTAGNAHILLGDGAGGFSPLDSFAGGAETADTAIVSMAVGDFNGDGRPDLAIGNFSTGVISIFLGNGDGTFSAGPTLAAGIHPDAIAVGDLNHDGIADIAVTNGASDDRGTSSVTVFLGKGDGTFTALAPFTPDPTLTGVNNLNSIAIGDIDNDGTPDLVVRGNGVVSVLLGNGDGTFRLGSEENGTPGTQLYPQSSGLALADVDGDGRTDILAPGENLAADVTEDAGLDVFRNEPETVVGSTSPSLTIDRAAVADPVLSKVSGGGTLSHVGNAYTLDLGTISAASPLVFSLANAATGDADSFDGLFSTPTGKGFTVTGADLAAALAAGQSYGGLTFTPDTNSTGTFTETITFAPRDATTVPVAVTAPDPDSGPVTPAATVTDTVGAELPAITLTVTDTVVAGSAPLPPTIMGTVANQLDSDTASLHPFATVMVADPNADETETVSVTPNIAADGTLSDPAATTDGGVFGAGGVFTVSGSATQVTTILQGLVFTPTPHQAAAGTMVTTSFTIAVSDTTGQTVSDATSSVVVTQSAGKPVVALRLVSDTGVSATDAITSNDALTGTAVAGDVVTISDAGMVLGTATADLSGAYNFTPTGLADGSYTLTASDTGGIGSSNLSFTLDTTAPALNDPALAVGSNAAAVAIGISTSDNISAAALLNASITALPDDGSVSLDGTAVAVGQVLTGDQLGLLTFAPTAGLSNVSSTLGYSVTDVAGNVATGAATLEIQALAGGSGDVHMVTLDGLHYDFQATGDFVVTQAARAGADDGFAVQMHTEEWDQAPNTSVATELAARIGQNVVRFGIDGAPVTVNGMSVSGFGAASATVQLDNGTLRQTGAGNWTLSWNSGETLTVTNNVTYLNFTVAQGPQDSPGTLQGLLGSDTGQASDLQLPDGEVLPQPLSPAVILGQFADAWRVGTGQSLLDAPKAGDLAGITPQNVPMTFLAPAVTVADTPGAIWTGSLGAPSPIEIEGASATLASGTLADLAAGDLIDIADFSGLTGHASYANGVIEVADAGHSVLIHAAPGWSGAGSITTTAGSHGDLLLHL